MLSSVALILLMASVCPRVEQRLIITFTLQFLKRPYSFFSCYTNPTVILLSFLGYGFVDFESPFAAEAAVKALQAQGIQAQMAKVCVF